APRVPRASGRRWQRAVLELGATIDPMNSSRARALALAAVLLKVVLLSAGAALSSTYPALEYLDKAVSFLLLALAAVWMYRFTKLARSGALWRVSRKLL